LRSYGFGKNHVGAWGLSIEGYEKKRSGGRPGKPSEKAAKVERVVLQGLKVLFQKSLLQEGRTTSKKVSRKKRRKTRHPKGPSLVFQAHGGGSGEGCANNRTHLVGDVDRLSPFYGGRREKR